MGRRRGRRARHHPRRLHPLDAHQPAWSRRPTSCAGGSPTTGVPASPTSSWVLPSRVPPEALEALAVASLPPSAVAAPPAPERIAAGNVAPRQPGHPARGASGRGGPRRAGRGGRRDRARGPTRSSSRASARAGGALRAAGVRRGDRVVVALRDGRGWFQAFLGAARIGAVPVAIDPRLRSRAPRRAGRRQRAHRRRLGRPGDARGRRGAHPRGARRRARGGDHRGPSRGSRLPRLLVRLHGAPQGGDARAPRHAHGHRYLRPGGARPGPRRPLPLHGAAVHVARLRQRLLPRPRPGGNRGHLQPAAHPARGDRHRAARGGHGAHGRADLLGAARPLPRAAPRSGRPRHGAAGRVLGATASRRRSPSACATRPGST